MSDKTVPVAIEAPPLGRRFSLAGFTGAGYERGANLIKQILWLWLSRAILMKWWCPNRLRVGLLRAFGARIGSGTLIRHEVKIHWPWKLQIGSDSWVGEDVWILNLEPVAIGSNTCVSQGVLLCTGSHDRHSPTFEFDNGPIAIGDGVWLAARAMVLRGVSIGDGATVAANTVVAQDVSAGSTVFAPRPVLTEAP